MVAIATGRTNEPVNAPSLTPSGAWTKKPAVSSSWERGPARTGAAEDATHRESIEVKNHADSLVYSTERTLREHGDKISAEDKAGIEAALNETREALKGDDLERIKQAQEALTQASHKLAEVMYRAAQQSGASAGPSPGPQETPEPGKGDVIDAEFKDLGEKK